MVLAAMKMEIETPAPFCGKLVGVLIEK